MLASNQPYQRVDDGIGAGLIGGAVVGGAMAGGIHAGGMKGINALQNHNNEKMKASNEIVDKASHLDGGVDVDEGVKAQKDYKKYEERGKVLNKAEKYHQKGFGGWKGRAASYGGSILAGAALGGIGDAII